VKNCSFVGNTASTFGGAIRTHIHQSGTNNQYIINTTFLGNSAEYGGALYSNHTTGIGNSESLTLVNALFCGNEASIDGGAIHYNTYQVGEGNPVFINVTFASNVAGDEGGALFTSLSVQPEVHSCILWGNAAATGAQVYNSRATDPVFYSCIIEGGVPGDDGGSNRSDNPLFMRDPDPGDADWTTLSDNDYGDLHLQSLSPGIDSGSNSALPVDETDLDGDGNTTEQLPVDLGNTPRINNSTVDIGAYEN
jgi:predicted outer membrane repeat protein